MRLIKLTIGVNVKAEIKVSFFKTKSIQVPSIHVAYILNDPNIWDELDKLGGKELMDELSIWANDLMNTDNQVFAEMLLKIAGEHPNLYENEFIKRMLKDRQFAIMQSKGFKLHDNE